jgi:hypothetical protein
VLDFLHKTGGQKPGLLFTRGPALLLIKASQTLLDRLLSKLDVEGVLGDFMGYTWHFCWAPRK